MRDVVLFLHLAAAILWMGGMAFMLFALRPALGLVEPPQRVRLLSAVLARFLAIVALSIVVLLASGGWMYAQAGAAARGWHAMALIGLLMVLLFGHLFFAPWRRLRSASSREDWPAAGRAAAQVALLAKVNFALGWIAIAAVMLWH